MHKSFNAKFGLPWVILHPGDYYASRSKEVVSTVLGSCIAVVLIDPGTGIAGMNHFMLPSVKPTASDMFTESGRYGSYAMDLLINEMMKNGASRSRLIAKVFGGGHVLHSLHSAPSDSSSRKGIGNPSIEFSDLPENVANQNISFALEYLRIEGIPLHGHDVGGTQGRKIFLFTDTGKVLLAVLKGKLRLLNVAEKESEYLRNLKSSIGKRDPDKDITLF